MNNLMMQDIWHSLDIKKIEEILKTDIEKGLSEREAEKRRKRFGLNKPPIEERFSSLKIFLSQFKSPLMSFLVFGRKKRRSEF